MLSVLDKFPATAHEVPNLIGISCDPRASSKVAERNVARIEITRSRFGRQGVGPSRTLGVPYGNRCGAQQRRWGRGPQRRAIIRKTVY